MKKIILTGDRPTGPLHLGHYIGSIQSRVQLQETYDQYVMIADIQALTDHFETPHLVHENVYEVAKDYLAIGLNPDISTIFIQSQVPELMELTVYFLNLVNVGRLERNPTVKAEIQQKGFNDGLPAGFLCYPVSQAADITGFQAELVPVGEDQVPMIEQTNEIVRRFNRIYETDCLKETKAYLSKTGRLVGLDGKAKASKSLGNTIMISDQPDVIKEKVFSMYTDPNHLKVTDPGQVEGNVVFAYLDAFYGNKEHLKELKDHYTRGGLGDMVIKKLLLETLLELMNPMRERRESLHGDDIQEMLRRGTEKARARVQKTMIEVRKAIGLNYF